MKLSFNKIVSFFLLVCFLQNATAQKNYMQETKKERDQRMQWWNEARFGMFIHWGLYAIPAGEWKGATNHAEWIRTTAQIPLDGTANLFRNSILHVLTPMSGLLWQKMQA